MTAELRATITHLREVNYCARGARAWFARHNLDWSAFLRQGIPVAHLEATGDALALRLAEHVRARRG